MNLGIIEIRCQNCFNKNYIETSGIKQTSEYKCQICEDRVADNRLIFRKALETIRKENERIKESYLSGERQ